jgi:hypothetical protein
MNITLPKCPKCADGGNVTLAEAVNEAASVFKPLPDGEREIVREYHCDCGWAAPMDEEES